MLVFVLPYFTLFYYYPIEAYWFSNERQKGVDPDRRGGVEELGGGEGCSLSFSALCNEQRMNI